MFYSLKKSEKKGSLCIFDPLSNKTEQEFKEELDLYPDRSLQVVPHKNNQTTLVHSLKKAPLPGRHVSCKQGWDGDGRMIVYEPSWYFAPVNYFKTGFQLLPVKKKLLLNPGDIVMKLNNKSVPLFNKKNDIIAYGIGYLIKDKVIFYTERISA